MKRSARNRSLIIFMAVGLFFLSACSLAPQTTRKTSMKKEAYGKTQDGEAVDLYTLTNTSGMEARIMTYGGIVVSLKTPDRHGKLEDVVLGFDSLGPYLSGHPFFGALAGRYGNRIANGKFSLNGTEYTLARNNGKNHLHGGLKGFDKKVWKSTDVSTADGPALELTYLSKDGEEGYPGNLSVTVTYRLTERNELKIDYLATTDQDTVVNLTNHSYFNLSGASDILQHQISINADRFTPVGEGLIPTGEIKPVKGTPLDFEQSTPIGARIDSDNDQLVLGKGYDHNFVLNHAPGELGLAATVDEPTTGRVMEVLTTEPGVQFYTGNFLDGSLTGKGGRVYQRRSGFCLETQHFPDSPNHPNFPTTVLKAGQKYQTTTIYKFSAK